MLVFFRLLRYLYDCSEIDVRQYSWSSFMITSLVYVSICQNIKIYDSFVGNGTGIHYFISVVRIQEIFGENRALANGIASSGRGGGEGDCPEYNERISV